MGDEASRVKQVEHGILLGRWMRERRLALRLTQEEVADRIGLDLPPNWVTQVENGARKRMIGQPIVGAVARALEATEADLLRGAGLLPAEAADQDAAIVPPAHRRVLAALDAAALPPEMVGLVVRFIEGSAVARDLAATRATSTGAPDGARTPTRAG